jgi:hypothetical protein
MVRNTFWEIFSKLNQKFRALYGTHSSFPCSQKDATLTYPEPEYTSPLPTILMLSLSVYPFTRARSSKRSPSFRLSYRKPVHIFYPIHATRIAHLIFLDFLLKYFWCGAGIAQSVQRLATGWAVRGSNPGAGEIFRTRP